MSTPRDETTQPISRRSLLQSAGALGLTAAGTWLRPAGAFAAAAVNPHGSVQPPLASSDHLVLDYLPTQPTGWPPLGLARPRNGVGVTLGGHISSVPFTFQGNSYEISLLTLGQPGSSPDPVYEPEPSDPTIDFKRILEKGYGAHYSFRYRGGLNGSSKFIVQSYSVAAIEPTPARPQVRWGGDVFIVYEPDPASTDPPITADLQWIQGLYSNQSGSISHMLDNVGQPNPYYLGAGLTSVYGKQVFSFYDSPTTGLAGKGGTGEGPSPVSQLRIFETFLARDTRQKDHTGKGVLDIYGGVKWGWQVKPVQP